MRRVIALGVFTIGVTLAIFGVGIMSVSVTPASPGHSVVICHATGSPSHPYVQLDVDIASNGYLASAHDIQAGDVIPPYDYGAFHFPGRNRTTQGQDIWLADCVAPAGTESAAGVNESAGGGEMSAGSAAMPAPSGIQAAGTADTATTDVIGIIMSTIGFLVMGLAVIAYRRREA